MLELIGVDGLTQWDVGRQVKVDKDIDMVHFSNRPYGYSKNVKVTNGVADVPDMFLTSCAPLHIWAYIGNFEKGYTKIEKIYEIKPKNRPEDYIYTPEEVKTWEKLQSEIGDLSNLETKAKENLVTAINEAAKSGGEDSVLYTAQSLTEEQQAQARANIGADLSTKMDANNPVGTGYFSMNRKAGTVVGVNSHAEGNDTTASGLFSHAEGCWATASGDDSHAEGNGTTASRDYSHAEGCGTTASGEASHAEGFWTTAKGSNSHAEGDSTNEFSSVVTKTNPTTDDIINVWKTEKFSVAKGLSSHVEGNDNLALGDSSHAEGNETKARGFASHAEGFSTTASGKVSHAEGSGTTARGFASHAEGNYTTASGDYSHVQGKCNIEDTSNKYADIIGNGTSATARSNAATVDWNGNAWFAGDVYTGSTSGTNKDNGSKKLATEEYVNNSIASGGTDISLGLTSAAVGQIIKVKAIDASGKPTAWEAADMPSGGGDTLLYHYDTSEDAIITSTALMPNLDISTTALLLFKWHINGYGTEFGGRLMINNKPITNYFPYIHRKAGDMVDIFCVVAVSDASLTVIKFIADSDYFTDSADFVCSNGVGNASNNIINIPNSGTIESFGIQGATVAGSTSQDKGEHLDYTTSGFSVDVYKVV